MRPRPLVGTARGVVCLKQLLLVLNVVPVYFRSAAGLPRQLSGQFRLEAHFVLMRRRAPIGRTKTGQYWPGFRPSASAFERNPNPVPKAPSKDQQCEYTGGDSARSRSRLHTNIRPSISESTAYSRLTFSLHCSRLKQRLPVLPSPTAVS